MSEQTIDGNEAIQKQTNVVRSLPVPLTVEERGQKGQELGRALAEISTLKLELKEEQDRIKNLIAAQQEVVDRLGRQLDTGEEDRSVECAWEMNSPQAGQKTLYRGDNGGSVETCPMNDEDHQAMLGEVQG